MQRFYSEWRRITDDEWVRQKVHEGLRLIFVQVPADTGLRETKVSTNAALRQVLLQEVESLLENDAIEYVPEAEVGSGFHSTFFVVIKPNGKFRRILNLRFLNLYLERVHFKMETLQVTINALERGGLGSLSRSSGRVPSCTSAS